MLFNSTAFLLFFFPVALLLYYIAPDKMKNGVLLLESIAFYSYGTLKYVPLLLSLVVLDYALALWMGSQGIKRSWKKFILIVGIVVNAAHLLIFKYGIHISQIFEMIGMGYFDLAAIIPLGFSYYSFKSISYLCDVYHDRCEPEKNIIDYATYVTMYQQIIVGPIIRYVDIKDALKQKSSRFDLERCSRGIRQFVYGLGKKVILADSLGLMWQEMSAADGLSLSQASSGVAWLAVISYSLQLYLDFSGYSDMSNGLSKIMGFECKDNFDYPYCATSFAQFWRRWHISLTEWFRDYVYIPLGGNREGLSKQIFNMLVVWILTGIWHGSTVNFLIWGVYCFGILVLDKLLIDRVIKNEHIRRIFTIFVAVVGWGIFASFGKISVVDLFAKLFSFSGGISAGYYIRNYGVVIILSVLVSGGIYRFLQKSVFRRVWVENAITLLLLFVCFAYVVGSTNNAALYATF